MMRMSSLVTGALPGLAILIGGLLALGYYGLAVHPRRDRQAFRRYAGSALVPPMLVGFFYWALGPLVHALARRGVTPNHITAFSLVLATVAAISFGVGQFIWGAWIFALAAACDGLDGLLARLTAQASRSGAFFDSFIDRLGEGGVYLGLAYYGQGGWLTWTAVAAIIASYAVSYARARGEALGVECKGGLMQRPERMVVLFVTTLGSPYLALYLEPGRGIPTYHLAIVGTGFIAAAALFTAVSRARWIFNALRESEASMPAEIEVGDQPLSTHFESGRV
ncbi:MAG: CDP-alcohol phosphatidyltransferase family protein [Bradymonadaceae bacterium]|nr:CDP-alcohol phosphatidyltransferase family protein [Lujinxingiaceae bacterium]